MELNSSTQPAAQTLHTESLDLQDVHGHVQELAVFVKRRHIAPKALPSWIAGIRHFDEHAILTPENRAPQRLAYLWLLDALIQSPEALTKALAEARRQLVEVDPALQPYAVTEARHE